jgi:hypothetical protein
MSLPEFLSFKVHGFMQEPDRIQDAVFDSIQEKGHFAKIL